MVVCHCRAVSDRIIRQTVERGAADVEEIATRCGAGSDCGGCRPTIEMLLAGVCPLGVRAAFGGDLDAVPAAS